MRRLLVICVVLVALAAAPSALATPYVVAGANPNYFGVANSTGVFYVATQCFTESGGNDVGPGYVFAASAIEPDGSWQQKTRDLHDYPITDPRNGGWAKFGIFVARPYQDNSQWKWWMKDVEGGVCAGHHPEQPWYNAGVSSSTVAQQPFLNSSGQIQFAIQVKLSDGLANILQITYNYRVSDTTVSIGTGVMELCNNGGGCNGNPVYVKEPKFVVNDGGNWIPYALVGDVNSNGSSACESPFWLSGSSNPMNTTMQCGGLARQQTWFKDANSGITSTDCPHRCTWVIAQAASSSDPVNSTKYQWEAPTLTQQWWGLDEWARLSKARAAFGSATEQIPNEKPVSTNCGNGIDSFRRWEVWRWSPAPDGSTSSQAGYHGWEGGYGLTDCMNLFKLMGPYGEAFRNYFNISFR